MSTPSDRSGAATAAEAPRPGAMRNERVERSERADRKSVRPGGPESLVGVVLSGRYRIEKLIGEGGMGAVYQAEHTHMRKRFAVKVLHAEMSRLPEVVARFEREALAAAHIEHPNVAAATDFGKLDDGSFFLVLEFVEGRSLRDAIAKRPMPLGQALHIARQIASGLGRAHAIGIVHRDLKPENVMLVARDDDPSLVKVLDFGIAKVPVGDLVGEPKSTGQVLTQLGMVYGTPEYMAPEQALGQSIDARADLYALGVIMFEMMTGSRPYDHESKVTLLGMHVTAPIPRMADRAPGENIPPEVDAIVTKLLAKDASGRYADARELIDALDQATGALLASGRIGDSLGASSMAHSARASGPRFSVADGVPSGSSPSVLGPTRLAVTSGSGPVARLRSTLTSAARAFPGWARRPVTVAALATTLGLAVIVAAISHGTGSAPNAASSASAPAKPPPPRVDPKINEIIGAAMANIEKGDFATAIEQLTGVERTNPERADIHMELERAYTGVRNGREAMREASLWLAADPTAAGDLKLQEDVRNAALLRDTQEDAFALLETRMGPRGIDILYDIAYGTAGKLYPQAAARAKRSLSTPEVRAHASPGLGILLDLREAKTCDAKHALLDRARDQGDARLLPMLEQFQQSRGCGFLGVSDCFPCMRRDDLLADAVHAIEQRAARAP